MYASWYAGSGANCITTNDDSYWYSNGPNGYNGEYDSAISAQTWTLHLIWSGAATGKTLTVKVYYSLASTPTTLVQICNTYTSTINTATGTLDISLTGNAVSPSSWYHVVLYIKYAGNITFNNGTYLSYPGTLVPENTLVLLLLAPVTPLISRKWLRKK
jgi:hypothetical protein